MLKGIRIIQFICCDFGSLYTHICGMNQ